MKSAIIYSRYSPRPKGKDEKCESCETQISYCKRWCDRGEITVECCYRDEAISGATIERPGLQQAIEHVCRIKGCLVVYSLSRLARSTKHAMEIAETLKLAGADLASIHESIDTSTPTGKLFYTIISAFNAFERELTSERTSEAMLRHIEAGRSMSSKAPYGYYIYHGRLLEQEYEQLVIAQIMEWHDAGKTIWEIMALLRKEGHHRRGKKSWYYRLVHSIIARQCAKRGVELTYNTKQEVSVPDAAVATV
jgi:site-specific DNA recombinase